MTPLFIKEFKEEHKCPGCNQPTKRSLCERHLEIAKLSYRIWYAHRKLHGKCCNCEQKAVKNSGRCKEHRKLNFERLETYTYLHPNHRQIQYKKQKQQKELYRSQGLCSCPSHNPLTPPFVYCEACRTRKLLWSADPKLNKRQTIINRKARTFSKVADAIAKLKELGVKRSKFLSLAI